MTNPIASHNQSIYLKPGEAVVTRQPALVSTVLGSCVAVTMFEPISRVGAICHAMLPMNPGNDDVLRYVDTALQEMHRKVLQYGISGNIEVKMFGGARVLNLGKFDSRKLTIGEQNVICAERLLENMRLKVVSKDVGGTRGRRLYFCTKSGDVYLKRLRACEHPDNEVVS
jgi:chemotaxis protein CheD